MKKFFSLLCALTLMVGANAVPQMKVRGEVKQMPDVQAPVRTIGQRIDLGRSMFRAPAGTPVSGITAVDCSLYQNIWYIDAFDASDNLKAEFAFYNGKDDQIAGQYTADGQYALVFIVPAAGDTVKASGVFNVAYVSEGTQYPIYHITATDLTDSLSRTFDFDFQLEIFAYDYEKYFYAMNYPDYCGLYFDCDYEIALQDAPVVVTGDTIEVAINGLKWIDKVADAGWWQIYGYSADSTYYVSFSNGNSVTVAAGTYDFADMDPDYTKFYIGNDEVKFDSGEIILSENLDGTYHLVATMLARDGKIYVLTLDSKLPTISENVITLSYNENTRSVEIATTNADNYFIYIESQEDYLGYQADYSQTAVNAETDDWISTVAYYGVLSEYTYSGNQSIDVIEFLGAYVATDDYVALAAPVDGSDRNGDAKHLLFHLNYPEDIENTDAPALKASKRLIDGQLIIEKNGVKYNAQGAAIK